MAGAGIHQYHHQQWAPPPPPSAAAAAAPPMQADSPYGAPHHHNPLEEVRTIFVLGFPRDVKERELQNLLRWWPGYEASQINFKGGQALGFALFSTPQFAMQARDALQNLVFDAEKNSILRAEMAKKNLYVKRGVPGVASDANSFDQSKRMRTGGDYNPAAYPAPGTYVPQPASLWGPQGYMAPPGAQYDPYGGYPVPQVQPVPMPVAPAGYAPVQNMKDNPPCNTLFIGNLGENTSEAELRGLFSGQPGFKQMKVLRQGRSTVCFIEFEDLNSALAVHNNLQGAVLTSSDRGGMRIQYSKNPYGRKKDGNGPSQHAVDGVAPGMPVQDLNGVPSATSQ
uniref:TSA: Wollemia nobilis Ref_Wollemi_Transcript_4376_1943 transcribed RNA sequence n=1 Tax=Wollemia nobilis TaxID=56998 RepID=A0A0C9SA94_9CONI